MLALFHIFRNQNEPTIKRQTINRHAIVILQKMKNEQNDGSRKNKRYQQIIQKSREANDVIYRQQKVS